MLPRFRSPALLLTSFLLVAATPGEQFMQDTDAWTALDAEHAADERNQSADIVFQLSSELFPDTGAMEEGSRLDTLRDERTEAFVSVQIDGKQVVFSDVPRTAWFAPYVRDIAERRVVSGYRDAAGVPTGLFGPGDNVTIEQMAKVMLYASGRAADACMHAQPLNLTASGTWSAGFMACGEQLQWAVYGDGTVQPGRAATRGEVVMTLMEAFAKETGPRTGTGFTDVTLSSQFGSAVEQAQRDGIVAGYTDESGMPTGFFGPDDAVTRAEFAKIVTLGIQLYAAQ